MFDITVVHLLFQGCKPITMAPWYRRMLTKSFNVLQTVRFSLTKVGRRHTRRSNSLSRKRRNRLYCGRHRHRELGLLGHCAFRDEAIPTVREVCLDPSAPCTICAHRLCRAPIRRLFRFDWRHGHRGSQQTFFFIDVPLCAEFVVGSCVGLLRLLPRDDFTAQGCVADHRWSMAFVQLGVHDRVSYGRPNEWTGYCGVRGSMIQPLLTLYG